MQSDNYYLALKSKPVTFEPVSAINNVFFDEVNKQIFTVRSGGATGVVIRGPDESIDSSFHIDATVSPISIKYSHQQEYLGIQRSKTAIEIFLATNGQPSGSQQLLTSKSPGNNIITFHWVNTSELILITKAGAEFYQISQGKKEIRLLKQYGLPVIWSLYLAEGCLLLCYSSAKGGTLYPFHFKGGKMLKMTPFHVDSNVHGQPEHNSFLNDKDVTLLMIYEEFYVGVVKHSSSHQGSNTQIELYLLSRDLPVHKKFIFMTKVQGRLALSVVDNLVVVHHQASKTSMIFDIRLPGIKVGGSTQLRPVVDPMPIQPQTIQVPGYSLDETKSEVECQMYAPTWIVFPPNIIIDAALGFMWFLEIKLDVVTSMFNDFGFMIEFLLLRKGSKSIILKSLKKSLGRRTVSPTYSDIGRVFDKLNEIYKSFLDADQAIMIARQKHDAAGTSEKALLHPSNGNLVVIDQSDMYMHVLSVIAREEGVDHNHIVSVVIEYIRSLNDFVIEPQSYLYELIIKALVLSKNFYSLEQYIHNGIIPLSKSSCGRLMSIMVNHPNSSGLAVDLCKMVPDCSDELIDSLLLNRKVLLALSVVKTLSMQNAVSARKFLEAAKDTGNDILFYETFKFFENRNYSLRGSKSFLSGEQCDIFVQYFAEKFRKT